MKEDLIREIELPEKTTVQIEGPLIKIIGPQGEVEKKLTHPRVKINTEKNKLKLVAKKATKTEKKIINSFVAHLTNMIKGVNEKYTYKLKICSGHFPMNVTVNNNQLIIKNFLGESIPRTLKVNPNVEVKIEGNEIIVTSTSKENAGQFAAKIEQLTKVKNKDIRIFQDGCHLINKNGKELSIK